MLNLGGATKVFLATGATDLRKSFDSLSALVAAELGGDPLSGHLFVFCNRRRDRLKALLWDGSGLILLCKRLEGGRFWWPGERSAGRCRELSHARLAALLEGLELDGARGRRGWYRR